MKKKLKDEVERIFRYLLQPIDEFEAIVWDGVIHPRRLDLLKETVNLFRIMEWSGEIVCVESAIIGWTHGVSFYPVRDFWSKKMDEDIEDDEKLTEDFENFSKDISTYSKMFNSHLPKLKERIQLVLARLDEEDKELE